VRLVVFIGSLVVLVLGLLIWNLADLYGQDNNTKLDLNNFLSVSEMIKENGEMFDRMNRVMQQCSTPLSQNITEQLACLRYAETWNTMMKTFENSTHDDVMKIMDDQGWRGNYSKLGNVIDK
jgi:hypothetical protein